jgi:enamine deaminase RidA (YjgF/YER057c/UK114 family)
MIRRAINPDTMYASTPFGFSHAVEQQPGRTLHLAGQVAWDSGYQLVGGDDVVAQARQALANLKQVLAAAGAAPADVVRMRTNIVNHDPEKLAAEPAANTVVGVAALALPAFLIEIEVTAALA